MNLEQAIKIMEQALNAASKAGVFNLQESATVYQALATIGNTLGVTETQEPAPEVAQPKVSKAK
jgi:prophage tail gpP-like protein